jgi:hypothetical protein
MIYVTNHWDRTLATCVAALTQTHTVTVRGFMRDGSGGLVEDALIILTNVDQ